MVDVGLHFRVMQSFATRRGKIAAVPTFYTADKAPRPVFGLRLVSRDIAEFRDIRAVELGNPAPGDFGAIMRAVQKYATAAGFVGGFPTFHWTSPGPDQKFGAILFRPGGAHWQDVAATDLGEPAEGDVGQRFRATQEYATRSGFAGGFPNFFKGRPGGQLVYGTVLFSKGAAEFRDVPADELGNASLQDPAGLMRSAQVYASDNGFVGAIPTFFTAEKGGFVCGGLLIDGAVAERRDIPLSTIRGLREGDYDKAMRDAHDYAVSQGFVAGFPTFYRGTQGETKVAGVVLLRDTAASWVDVPSRDLGDPAVDDIPQRFRATQAYAKSVGGIGGFPNFYHAKQGQERVFGTIVLRPPGVTFKDAGVDELYDDTIVTGVIRQHWKAMGGAAGPLGLPTSSERTCADGSGKYNTFAGGDIYDVPGTGALTVMGQIRDRWRGTGAEAGYYGYPRSDERDWIEPGQAPGRISDFELGSIGLRSGAVVEQMRLLNTVSAKKPWAVILCRFKGDPPDPARESDAESFFREIFTPGTGGMVEYWRDVSLGAIDITGSRVFDWVEVDVARSEAGGNHRSEPKGIGRKGLIDAGIRALQARGEDPITGFHKQLTVYTRRWSKDGAPADADWETPGWAPFWIDGSADGEGRVNLTPPFDGNVTAHEMGHGFGMNHDVAADLETAYSDPCCIMSQKSSFVHPRWQAPFGPAVCLPHLLEQGWITPDRVVVDEGGWMNGDGGVTIPLAPVSRPWARGNLGARLRNTRANPAWDYYIECVAAADWTRGLNPTHQVLIRRVTKTDPGDAPAILAALPFENRRGWTGQIVEPSGNVLFHVEVLQPRGPVVAVTAQVE